MGNYKFRLSEMIPNAWFYKLKEMGKGKEGSNVSDGNSLKKKKKRSNGKASSSPAGQLPASPRKSVHHNANPRKSYYFTREFQSTEGDDKVDQTKKMVKQRIRKKNSVRSPRLDSPAAVTPWKSEEFPGEKSSAFTPDEDSTIILEEDSVPLQQLFPLIFRADQFLETQALEQVAYKSCDTSSSGDVIIGVDSESIKCSKPEKPDGEVCLPPIVTKQVTQLGKKKGEGRRKKDSHCAGDGDDQQKTNTSVSPGTRRYYQSSANSPGIKLRTNSPRIGSRKSFFHHQNQSVSGRKSGSRLSSSSRNSVGSRKSLSASSLAIVKSSFNPQKDFRESMLEMITENKLSESKDLEDLLACYLSLNSDEYHGLIINVFKQIWFDLTDVKLM